MGAIALALSALAAAPAAAQLPPLPNPLPPPGGSEPDPNPKAPPGPTPGDEATGYQGDSAHAGLARTEDLFPPLGQRWSARLAGDPGYPLIADGRVFVVDGEYGTRSTLRAFRLSDGRKLWASVVDEESAFARGHSTELAIEGARIFVPYELEANTTIVRAYDAVTGSQLWDQRLPGSQHSGPAVENGVVVVTTTRAIYGLDAASGQILWRNLRFGGELAVRDGRVISALGCGDISAHDLADGRTLWERTLDDGGSCPADVPAIAGGRVYSARLTEVVDVATGATVARAPESEDTPVIAGDLAIFLERSRLRARPLAGGAPVWSRSVGRGFVSDPLPLATRFNVYAAAENGSVYAFDRATGVMRDRLQFGVSWGQNTDGHGFAAAQGTLIVPTFGRLRAYTNLLRPPPRGIDLVHSTPFLRVGDPIYAAAAVGRHLRDARPIVRLMYDRFPYGRWRRDSQGRGLPEGTAFFFRRITRNTRLRIVTASGKRVRTRVFRAYSYPRVRMRFRATRTRRVRGFFTIIGPRDMRAGGLAFHMYIQRRGRGRLYRIASARLRNQRPGRATGESLVRLKRVGRRDAMYFCVRGIERRGFGQLDRLGRHCGARRTRL